MKIYHAAFAALLITGSMFVQPAHAQSTPQESYRTSCTDARVEDRTVCRFADGREQTLMPGEASISLALRLKETCIPVVMISGSHDAMEYAERNDLQLLRKPFHTQELYNAINTALASGEFGQRDA
jgi:FixJ family two-component response regulator